jgi:hypothetical protein
MLLPPSNLMDLIKPNMDGNIDEPEKIAFQEVS